MSERLTESEKNSIEAVAMHSIGCNGYGSHAWLRAADLHAEIERILTDRLAARGAGDGLAAELLAHLWTCPLEAFACTDPVHAEHAKYALDPDTQGADE